MANGGDENNGGNGWPPTRDQWQSVQRNCALSGKLALEHREWLTQMGIDDMGVADRNRFRIMPDLVREEQERRRTAADNIVKHERRTNRLIALIAAASFVAPWLHDAITHVLNIK